MCVGTTLETVYMRRNVPYRGDVMFDRDGYLSIYMRLNIPLYRDVQPRPDIKILISSF